MPVSFKAGTFQRPASTAVPFDLASITGLSFQPKAIIFWTTAVSGSTAWTNIWRCGMGWTAGSTQNYSMSFGDDDAATTTNNFRRARNDYCLRAGSSGGAGTSVAMKLSTFNSDGATFTYDVNDGSTHYVFYIAIGGTDISNVKAGEFLPNTTTGNQTVTGVGFAPDIVFFTGGNSANNPTTSTPHMSWFWGAAADSTQQQVQAVAAQDGVTTTVTGRYQRTDNNRCIAFYKDGDASVSTGIDAEASYVASVSDGFTINWTDAPTAQQPIYYLAIKGGSWKVGSFAQPTVSGTNSISGLGITPKGLILHTTQDTTRTTPTTTAKHAFGAADSSTSMWSITHGSSHGVTTTETMRGHNQGSTSILRMGSVAATPNSVTDISASADFSSFGAGSFTLNWTLADANARMISYVAVGDNSTLVKLPSTNPEAVGITEALRTIKGLNKLPSTNPESVGITESVIRASGRIRLPTTNPEAVGITETTVARRGLVKKPTTNPEAVGITETTPIKITSPVVSLQATSIKLRFSGGSTVSISTSSRGGAISNNEVTDNTLNAAWDDVTSVQASTGLTEYRCFYLYNSHSTLTAYNTSMWIDTQTPGADSIEIAIGTAAINATEQGPLAAETTAPTSVLFSSSPDEDSAIPMGDIPPLGYRSFWVKRIVPAGTGSWNDNTYVLRLSFVSDHL